jgi:cell division protein FtsI (penicillin-binding protein 3)
VNVVFKQRRIRIGVLTVVLATLFALVALRLTLLVLLDGPRLASMAANEHTGEVQLAAVRGTIVDRNGTPLALSSDSQSIYARPRRLRESSSMAERAVLAQALAMAPGELEARLQSPAPFIWLGRHIQPEQANPIEELGLDGVAAVAESSRRYPEGPLAAAVVGKAGMDGQGLSGVELKYDEFVRGKPVKLRFERDALGHPIFDSPVELLNAQPGAKLELTIDSAIQAQAESALAAGVKRSGARRGVAIVLEPFTGEVLALANATAAPASDDDRLHDAAVQDAFEPGSTAKGILGAIALDDRVIDTGREIYCENGAWQVGGKAIHDDSPHGWLDLGGIVEVSSNIGAAKIALALGAERYYAGLQAFGFGRKTGIDLPGEASGLIRPATRWRPIDLADHGFGQGIAVTPIQLATAYAAIANGGVMMRPYVVKAAYDGAGHKVFERTAQASRRAVTPQTAHTMNDLLRNVVSAPDGTGRLARVADFTVAGKTGTAQMVNGATGVYYQGRLVGSFVGFVPAKDPRLVILVVLYDVPHGHFGGLFAAPAFSAIASNALQHLDVAPEQPATEVASILPFAREAEASTTAPREQSEIIEDRPEIIEDRPERAQAEVAEASAPAPGLTPNFIGLSLRGALALARLYRLNPAIAGAGYVAAQAPRPGLRSDGTVRLALASDLNRAPSTARRPTGVAQDVGSHP